MSSSLKALPEYVPTLMDVVELPDSAVSDGKQPHSSTATEDNFSEVEALAAQNSSVPLEDDLFRRVMDRVGQSLDERLEHTMADIMREHLQMLLPRLQDEVVLVVKEAVRDALAAEKTKN